jgi:hypothetical protein
MTLQMTQALLLSSACTVAHRLGYADEIRFLQDAPAARMLFAEVLRRLDGEPDEPRANVLEFEARLNAARGAV